MQASFSTGNDFLRFPQVTGGNLPAPAGNLREDFIVRVRVDFFKPRDIFFHPAPNNFTKITTKLILSWKIWTVHCWPFNPLSNKNTAHRNILHYRQLDQEQDIVTFSLFPIYQVKENCQATTRIWAWIPLESIVHFRWDVTQTTEIVKVVGLLVKRRTRWFSSEKYSWRVRQSNFPTNSDETKLKAGNKTSAGSL